MRNLYFYSCIAVWCSIAHCRAQGAFDEQGADAKSLAQILAGSPSAALDSVLQEITQDEEGEFADLLAMAADLHSDPARISFVSQMGKMADDPEFMLFVEWFGGGIGWEGLLFASGDMSFYAYAENNPEISRVRLDDGIMESIAIFRENMGGREAAGHVSAYAEDTPLFSFSMISKDDQNGYAVKTFIFYDLESFVQDGGGDAWSAIIDLKQAIDGFIKRKKLAIDIYASGA